MVYYLLFISYFLGGWQLFQIGSFGFKPIDLVVVFLFIQFIKRAFIDGKKFTVPKSFVFILLCIVLMFIPISFLYPLTRGNSDQIIQFFKTSSHFYYLAIIGIYLFLDPPDEKVLKRCIQIFLIISLGVNIFGIYQIFARAFNLPLAWIQFTNVGYVSRGLHASIEDFTQLSLKYENFFRATSIFPEPSALASLNVIVILLNIVPFVQKTGMFFKNKFLNISIFCFSIITTFLTFSLTGTLGITLVVLGLIFFHFKEVKKYFLPMFVGAIVILILVDAIVNSYLGVSVAGLFWNRITSIFGYGGLSAGMSGESVFGRLDSQFASLRIWIHSPIIGVGFGCTEFYGTEFINTDNLAYKILFPDTTFMCLLSETGIFSALTFTTMFGILFYKAAKYVKNLKNMELSPDMKRFAGIMFFWLLQITEINFLTGFPLVSDWFWLPFGLMLAIEHKILIQNDAKCYSFSFVKYPLKESLIRGLSSSKNK